MNDELKAATERWKKGDYRGKRTTYTLDPQLMADMALLADHAAASLADAPLTPMTHRALRTYDEFKPHRKPVEVAADCVRKGDKLAVERLREEDSLAATDEWFLPLTKGFSYWRQPAIRLRDGQLVLEQWGEKTMLSFAYRDDTWQLIENPTRGDVRRLCEALGIELKSEEPK